MPGATQTFLGAALALAFWPGLHSAALAPRWAIVAIAGPILAGFARRVRPAVLLLLAWPALTLLWTPGPLTATGDLIHLGLLVLAFMACRGLESVEPLLLGMAWGVAAQAPLVVAQLLGFTGVEQLSVPPAGLFLNRDLLGEFAAPLALWAILVGRQKLGLLLLGIVLASQSRIAIGLIGLSLALWASGWLRYAAFGFTMAAAALILDPTRWNAVGTRFEIWQSALGGLTPFGSGLGSFTFLHPYWEFTHSDLLQGLFELGLPAITGAVVLVFWFKAASPPFYLLLSEAIFDFPLHLPETGFLFVALLASLVRQRSDLLRAGFRGGSDHLRPLRTASAEGGHPAGACRRHFLVSFRRPNLAGSTTY